MAYTATVWVNLTTPALNATNLNKVTDELKAQAAANVINHTLPTWANGVVPAVSDPVPLNEMERVAQAVAVARGLSYTPTVWQNGWLPARNAANLNKLEQQVQANSQAATPTAPSTTQALQATGGTNQVSLSWTAPASNGNSPILGYYIYRGGTAGSETRLADKPGTGTTYVDSLAVAGSTYFYRVSAYNAVGEGVWSNEVSATATGSPPAGFAIPTYQVSVPQASGISACWIHHTDGILPVGSWGGVDCRRIVWSGAGNQGYEYWIAYECFFPTAFTPNNNYAFPLDFHSGGDEPGWTAPAISATHNRYFNANHMLQHQPNFDTGSTNQWAFNTNVARNTWISVLLHIIYGRMDGTVSAVGHPNAGHGRSRVYINGNNTPTLDTGDISNITRVNGQNDWYAVILEGMYFGSTGAAYNAQFTALRIGTTLAQCLGSSGVTRTGSIVPTGLGSFSVIASRQSTDFLAPSNPQ